MIVIPMAGLGRRFSDQGYDEPKFMLPLWDGTVFDYALTSFRQQFQNTPFLLIYRETGGVREFIEGQVKALGISQVLYSELEVPTTGQAETIEAGLLKARVASHVPLTIFNIDTFRLPGIEPTGITPQQAGWLEVFRGVGENWSFIRVNGKEVIETAEKVAISDLCCTGLYGFDSATQFQKALAAERARPSAAELYVAPLYNYLIADKERISFNIVDRSKVLFCGVPSEYEALKNRPAPYILQTSERLMRGAA